MTLLYASKYCRIIWLATQAGGDARYEFPTDGRNEEAMQEQGWTGRRRRRGIANTTGRSLSQRQHVLVCYDAIICKTGSKLLSFLKLHTHLTVMEDKTSIMSHLSLELRIRVTEYEARWIVNDSASCSLSLPGWLIDWETRGRWAVVIKSRSVQRKENLGDRGSKAK